MTKDKKEKPTRKTIITEDILEKVAGGEGERKKKRRSDDITTPEI